MRSNRPPIIKSGLNGRKQGKDFSGYSSVSQTESSAEGENMIPVSIAKKWQGLASYFRFAGTPAKDNLNIEAHIQLKTSICLLLQLNYRCEHSKNLKPAWTRFVIANKEMSE